MEDDTEHDAQDAPRTRGPRFEAGDSGTQRKQWTQLEDDTVRQLVHEHGTRAWTIVAHHLPGRTGKQCRER